MKPVSCVAVVLAFSAGMAGLSCDKPMEPRQPRPLRSEWVLVGTRINIADDTPLTFAAGAPFSVQHGWRGFGHPLAPWGKYAFQLEIDGIQRREDFVLRSVVSGEADTTVWLWVFNFPEGMRGTHTFRGHWMGPCQTLLERGWRSGPCPSPEAQVEALHIGPATRTVTFN